MTSIRPGTTITFYSYKGGTGRSMALANAAVLLAAGGRRRVLVVDWDLDAPGLHRYFRKHLIKEFGPRGDVQLDRHPGLLDLWEATAKRLTDSGMAEDSATTLASIRLSDYVIETDIRGVSLLKAGTIDDSYESRVNSFSWQGLFKANPDVFESFSERLASDYEYVLIDSRTGHSDVSGICTTLLPDKLVLVFAPNKQNIDGIIDRAKRAIRYRKLSPDTRPLLLFPLATRIEAGEPELRNTWRRGNEKLGVEGFQTQFEALLQEAYDLDSCDLESYFDEIQIQQVPRYAYGEEIAVVEEPSEDVFSMGRSFNRFAELLAEDIVPWEFEASIRHPVGSQPHPEAQAIDSFFAQENQIHSFCDSVIHGGEVASLRRVARSTRATLANSWLLRMKELNETTENRRFASNSDIYDFCLPIIQQFEPDILGLEQAGLEFIDAEYPPGLAELFRIVEQLLGLPSANQREQGRTFRPVTGSPEAMSLRLMVNWGAKACDTLSLGVAGQVLKADLMVEELNTVSMKPFYERDDILHTTAFLGEADLNVTYVQSESWKSPRLQKMFGSQREYDRGLANFLFMWALLYEKGTTVEGSSKDWPLYPAFKKVDPDGQSILAFYMRISRSVDLLSSLANMLDEDIGKFRTNWPARIRRLNEASLGTRYFSHWRAIPEVI